jgi:uncharacterized protein YkwD
MEKKHISVLFASLFLVFAVLAPTGSAAPLRSNETGFLQAVNETRAANGLRPLRLDFRLRGAAREHSVEMLRRNTFAHGDFVGRMLAFHIGGFTGENLAWGSGSYGSPRAIVNAWLHSPEHRANLLRPRFRRIGIGLARGTFLGYGGATVVTADFSG